jgi:hypothetical protein
VIGAIVKILTGGLVDKVFDLGQAYLNKQISEAEFRAKVEIAAQETAAEIEQSWAQAATDTAKATQATVKASSILQRAWAAVLFLQVAVLVWYQIGAPAFQVITGTAWPHPGISLEWAYLLVATMIGAGPLVLRR